MPSKVSTVNFGASNASLATVGYTIYKEDESVQQARTTTGVSELGTATGIYRATINYPIQFRGFVLWDTGEGSPQYAAESINPLDADSVADEIRTMLRSLNTSLSSHLERLLGRKKSAKENVIDLSPIEKKLMELQKMISGVDETIGAIQVNPEISMDVSKIESMVESMKKESFERNESVKQILRAVHTGIDIRLKTMAGEIRKTLSDSDRTIREIDIKSDARVDKKMDFFSKVLDSLSKEMIGDITASVDKLIKRLGEKTKAEETLETLLTAMKNSTTNGNGKRQVAIDTDLRNLLISLR